MKKRISLRVNGETYEVEVEPRESLLDVLRNKLSLLGTKKGGNTGDCGACTVILDKKPVNSCLVLGVEAEGKEILTIEGLARPGKLHPLQEAFIKFGAVQCGYCTPGMILSAKALLDENPQPSEEEIKRAIAGNLCRCAGGRSIFQGAKSRTRKNRGGEHGRDHAR